MQQEIALSYTVGGVGVDSGKVRVIVLQGNGLAHFVQSTNVTAGNFATTATGLLFPRLVVGDFLSQGRDQLLLAAYDQTSGAVSMDVLEFDNGTHAATVTTALPSLGNDMRGAHFASPPLNATGAKFFYDDGTFSSMTVNGLGIPLIEVLEANGGDLVDTAADELVLHLMFIDPVQAKKRSGAAPVSFPHDSRRKQRHHLDRIEHHYGICKRPIRLECQNGGHIPTQHRRSRPPLPMSMRSKKRRS